MQAFLDHAAANPGATIQCGMLIAATIIATVCGFVWLLEETKSERRRRQSEKRRDKARAKRLAAYRRRVAF